MKLFSIKVFLLLFFLPISLLGCSMNSSDSSVNQDSEMIQIGEASYEEYTSNRFDEIIGNKSFILFFHADWCPLCKRLEGLLKEDLASLGSAIILEVNYDKESDLKKEYGVTAQTTVLFFDENGEMIDKKINPSIDMIRNFFVE